MSSTDADRHVPLIAIEEHWTTGELTEALRAVSHGRRDESLALNELDDNLPRLLDLADGRIATMDEQGIDLSVLALTPPATGPLDATGALAHSRHLNDVAAAAVNRYPSRLRALATLPMSSPEAAAAELERAAGLGFVGVMVYGRTGEVHLDDPCYRDLFATAARTGLPVFIHPQIPSDALRRSAYTGLGDLPDLALSTFGWGWHVEAAVAALRLMVAGTLDRHPDLQIVLGHWGELLPFWSERTDSLARITRLDRSISEYIRSNVHLTASGMLSPALLHHALEVTTPDRLIFSTDYPFQRPNRSQINSFLDEFADGETREMFSSTNARKLFGINL